MNDQANYTDARKRLRLSNAELMHTVELWGDHLAEKNKYKIHRGLDAVRYFLMMEFKWLPRDVRSMNDEDLYFASIEAAGDWRQLPLVKKK